LTRFNGSWLELPYATTTKKRKRTLLPCTFTGPPRKGHTTVMADNRMILFGGRGDDDMAPYDDDVHILNAGSPDPTQWTWRVVEPASGNRVPTSRNHHAAAMATADIMVVVGGRTCHDCEPLDDAWTYSVKSNTWEQLETLHGPLPRFEAVAWSVGEGSIRIATGQTYGGEILNDVWRLEVASRTKASYVVPWLAFD